jgi:hypothetical protein
LHLLCHLAHVIAAQFLPAVRDVHTSAQLVDQGAIYFACL